MAFLGAATTGISWDERVHGLMFQAWLDTGKYWLPDFDDVPMRFIYGPIGDLAGHAFAIAAREDGLRSVGFTARAFAARHVATATVGLFGVLGVALITRVLLNSWRWAVLAGAVLTSVPLWTGHSMFNMKDIMVATGYTWVTLGLVVCARQVVSLSWRDRVYGGGAFFIGAILATGMRTAMWLPIAVSVVATWLLTFLQLKRLAPLRVALRRSLRQLLSVAVSALAAYAVLSLVYPAVWSPPFAGVRTAVSQSADFEASESETPWTYIPDWFGHQLPLLLLGFVVIGAIGSVSILLRLCRRDALDTSAPGLSSSSALLLIQAALMPVAAMILHSPLYDGVRHFLFVVPALSVLSAIGMWILLSRAVNLRRYLVVTGQVLIAVAILIPTFEQSRMFPYNYTYFNALATAQPVAGRWPTDYWRTSWRELVERIPNNDLVVCPPRIVFENDIAPNWPRVETYSCRFEYLVSPYLLPEQAGGDSGRSPVEYWILRENYSGYYVPRNCTVFDEITRPLRGQDVMMSYLLRCSYAPGPPLG